MLSGNQCNRDMTTTLLIFLTLFWYGSALLLASEFGEMDMGPSFALVLVALVPVLNTALWVILRSKRTKKEGKKFITFSWIGSFSEIFKRIRTYYE